MARNPITIEVLETLDAIDRRGSFAKAAEGLNKARVVKKLVRRPNGNISTAHPSVRYSRLSCNNDFLLFR